MPYAGDMADHRMSGTGIASQGTVRSWNDEDGWGVIDSEPTPGGCWAHFADVAVVGHRTLLPGQQVEFQWESADQDGFAFRATRVWPAGTQPVADAPAEAPGGAYSSSLRITLDEN